MSDSVTFKLDGRDVAVPKGWTVMQAARRENVHIPHFCYHDGLSVAGVCRFCMVKVEGRPKMEIACNLLATEGMVVETTSDDVKQAHKWGLEFHLVNHPLDCPICDQAGECELQNSYMKVGKYKSEMHRPKVLKPKNLDVGSQLILDTERCILCSRCVRFEEEVTKTNGLGIFDRGDRAIIGTYAEEKIEHNYQENLVDICPVGAFTSKEFRFKQRVWFLEEKDSICNGCSTGCHISMHGKSNELRYYRVKPKHSAVNGHWMCDEGRHSYRYLNPEERLSRWWYKDNMNERIAGGKDEGLSILARKLKDTNIDEIALLVSAHQTNEEYEALLAYFVKELGISKVYQWRQDHEDINAFDGILLRGDRNPNTLGLQNALTKFGLKAEVKNEFEKCLLSGAKVVIALCPESPQSFPELKEHLAKLSEMPFVSAWSAHYLPEEIETISHTVPLKGFVEKRGSFTNHEGNIGELSDPFPAVIHGAVDVCEMIESLRELMG
ncbi:MAG: 2Fe-2S iron-sulfur cluster-binding protein [Bdellovibrionota bacterium]